MYVDDLIITIYVDDLLITSPSAQLVRATIKAIEEKCIHVYSYSDAALRGVPVEDVIYIGRISVDKRCPANSLNHSSADYMQP